MPVTRTIAPTRSANCRFIMQIPVGSVAFWIAAMLAAVMGFAIQRGATCTVAAVDELVNERRAHRLAAMLEASWWVLGGLVIAQALHALPVMPARYAPNAFTLAGAVLLGVGAYVNGACVFGAIARLGSGEWAYLLTPLGFYVGCVSVGGVFVPSPTQRLNDVSPLLNAPMSLATVFVALMALRLLWASVRGRDGVALARERRRSWAVRGIASAHAATGIIGITFVLILLLVGGTWAYTDVLAELAHGMAGSIAARVLLVVALLAGAVVGGWTASRLRSASFSVSQAAKCLAGGVSMGWGSLLIPGSNDGLILVGIPLLFPYAWIAFATMVFSIAAAMLLRKSFVAQIVRRSGR